MKFAKDIWEMNHSSYFVKRSYANEDSHDVHVPHLLNSTHFFMYAKEISLKDTFLRVRI